jgi:hypothetical protein
MVQPHDGMSCDKEKEWSTDTRQNKDDIGKLC